MSQENMTNGNGGSDDCIDYDNDVIDDHGHVYKEGDKVATTIAVIELMAISC